MKRYVLILLVIAALIGCSKAKKCEWEELAGSGTNPCFPHPPCDDYPDESVIISWNDYNTCGALYDYFGCHRKAQEEHRGDTLQMVGWLDLNDEPDFGSNEHQNYFLHWAKFTDDSSHHPEDSRIMTLKINEGFDFSEFKDKKMYVTGIFTPWNLNTGDCCSLIPTLLMLSIDTINDKR